MKYVMYKLVQIKKGQHVFACHKTFNWCEQVFNPQHAQSRAIINVCQKQLCDKNDKNAAMIEIHTLLPQEVNDRLTFQS